MSKSRSTQSFKGMELLFSMLLFLVFVLSAVFTILIGSRVYENIRSRNDAAFYSDTALGYVTNKVRQADRQDCVAVKEVDGSSVLVLSSVVDDITYETWIYSLDGTLKELYARKDIGLTIYDGLDIMECGRVSFSMDTQNTSQILTINLGSGDTSKTSKLSLRSDNKGGKKL